MEQDLIKTFLIPNELCRRAGLGAAWLPIDQLSVFGYHKITRPTTLPSTEVAHKSTLFAGSGTSVYHLRHEVVLFNPILRKLVNETNGTFLSVQQAVEAAGANNHAADLLNFSRQYRSIIRACLENLNDEIVRAYGELRDELQNYITIFYSIECIWHLCDILFIDSVPGNLVLTQLLDWIRFHFPKYERNAAAMLANNLIGLETNPDYWETVIGLLLQGRIKIARALLKQHTDADSQPFRIVDQSLKTMPIYNMSSGISVNEFKSQWQQWVADVQSKIDAKLFISSYNLNLIMKLTVGNEIAWGEIQQYCECWYELLAAWLFYTEPTVKRFELGRFARQCIAKMSIRNRMRHLDKVLLAAMEVDILQVIKEIQHMTENGWFVTHLTDLFYHSKQLDRIANENNDFSPSKLRESFLIDYGTLMMSHKSLWQVGLNYLDYCTNDGQQVIKLLLPRITCETEMKTLKVLREAINRNMDDIAQSICKVQGIKFINRGRLGSALTWALKSQDSAFISYLADKFLREYSMTDGGGDTLLLLSGDLFDNLGSCILASNRLMFLGQYHEFHKLYKNKEYKQAGYLLISLLDSKIVPNYFWSILLVDTIPLLECEEYVFTSTDTFKILQCLERKEFAGKTSDDKIDLLRLATARNLARALINEAQITK